jgi:hypothetical protein
MFSETVEYSQHYHSLFYVQFNMLKYASMHFSPHAITIIILYGAKFESLINFTQPSSHIVLGSSGLLGVPYPNTRRLRISLNNGSSFPTVCENLSVPYSKVPTFWDNLSLLASTVFEDGTVRLYRTFGKELPLLAA